MMRRIGNTALLRTIVSTDRRKVKAGDLVRDLRESLSLCSDCSGLFIDWLRSGNPTH